MHRAFTHFRNGVASALAPSVLTTPATGIIATPTMGVLPTMGILPKTRAFTGRARDLAWSGISFSRKLRRSASCAILLCLASACFGQEVRPPASSTAGEEASISTGGSGKATFYLSGPGVSRKAEVNLGEEIHLSPADLTYAGEYIAVVCSSSCEQAGFFVNASQPHSMAFLVHPSRVPVAEGGAVSGTVFPFDQYGNMVLAPEPVKFQLVSKGSSAEKETRTQGGVAWFRTGSGKAAGMVQVVASLGDLTEKRALQQVASDPCNLRIKGERTRAGIVVETEPVHDCAGNVVPDGTIVTFTASDSRGKSSVDAPIKQGIARAEIDASGAAVISVASGVVMGNELRIGAQ